MNRLCLMIVCASLVSSLSLAAESPETRFAQAAEAYTAGRYEEAATRYEELLSGGYFQSEVLFNLGNALFRLGRKPEALARYRESLHLQPRDPDIRANLELAVQTTGGLPSVETAASRLFGYLSPGEWAMLFWLSYGLVLAPAFLQLALRKRGFWLRWALLPAALLALSFAGLLHGQRLRRHPEAVVLAAEHKALFAPMPDALPHFATPQGSVVRVLETQGTWCRVASGEREGWLPTETLRRISHPQPAWFRLLP